jgi:protoporphyrinogen oxidase
MAGAPHTPPVLVIGAGLTGLSAAQVLGDRCRIFEAADRVGGLVTSETVDGYTFDRTGHWLHVRDPTVKEFLFNLDALDWLTVQRNSKAFSRGVLTGYPFQVHLCGHDPQLIWECLVGLWRTRQTASDKPKNFEEFIVSHYGQGIARRFLIPYNEKLWGVHPREMTTDWCQRFFPVIPAEQILAGAVGARLPKMGYNVEFLYPAGGGIERLPQALARRLEDTRLDFSCPVEKIDHVGHRVQVGGQWHDYRFLISTMPLVALCQHLVEPPRTVEQKAAQLKSTAVSYLDVSVRPKVKPDYHWVYLPDPAHPAYRIGIYSNVAAHMAPADGSALYVELADRDRYGSTADAMAVVGPAMVQMGLLSSTTQIQAARLRRINHAYVIYDHCYADSREFLLSFFRAHGIYSCGRYGSWIYGSMEDAILEGWKVGRTLEKHLESS